MTTLLVIFAILFFFVLLFTLPVHLTVSLCEDVRVAARVLFVKIPIFPTKGRKEKKPKKKEKSKRKLASSDTKKAKTQKKKEARPKQKRDIKALVKLLLKIVTAVLKKIPKHVRVRVHAYEISVATGDAAKTALLYGTVRGLSENIFALLESTANFKIKKKASVGIYADFLGEKSKANDKLDFIINLWGIFAWLLAAGIAFIKSKNQNG